MLQVFLLHYPLCFSSLFFGFWVMKFLREGTLHNAEMYEKSVQACSVSIWGRQKCEGMPDSKCAHCIVPHREEKPRLPQVMSLWHSTAPCKNLTHFTLCCTWGSLCWTSPCDLSVRRATSSPWHACSTIHIHTYLQLSVLNSSYPSCVWLRECRPKSRHCLHSALWWGQRQPLEHI